MEREAFSRAWRFLNYKPVAKWLALLAAVSTGILYILLLILLGLFADLLVNRGHIPGYRDITPASREIFERNWFDELSPPERKQRLEAIGIDAKTSAALAEADPTTVKVPEKSLFWRALIHRYMQDRVGDTAAAYVLPEFPDLPVREQEAFQQSWLSTAEADRSKQLQTIIEEDKANELAKADAGALKADDWSTIWRAYLYDRIKEQSGSSVANTFLSDRRNANWTVEYPVGLPERELHDRGVLSLVIRTKTQTAGPVLGFFAKVAPWSWKWSSTERPNFYSYLSGLLALGIGIAVLRALAMYLLNYMAAIATIEASNRLRRAVYHHTFRLGRLAFRALGPSEAVGIFTRQVETLHNGLYIWLTVIFREPVQFGLLLAFALALNFWLAVAFLVFALLIWVIGGQVAVYFRRQERVSTRLAADQIALLQESLMMMRLVKCYLMELFNQSRVERQLSRYAAAQLRRYRGEAIYRPLLLFLGSLAAIVLIYVAGLTVLSGRLGVASAITLMTALVSLYLPLIHWLEQRRLLRKAREAATILFKFLDRPGEVGQAVGAEFLSPLSKSLVFDNVSLQEPGTGRKLLQSVNLTIQAGQRIALVGSDEMQKLALVYLIPRFLDPSSGEILIDSHNLRWVTFDSLRAQIAMVMQHNLIFNDTVANNISCGDTGYDLPKIIEAAKIAHAHKFIQKLPKGYETSIGELGHFLNSSEQFRIALARALMRDPALLIIEEPSAVLDEDTKSLLDDTFARILPGRTVIFLPHRISTIRNCDRIFLINKGRVEATGDHRELLAQNDLYKHLHYMEFNEFAEQI